MIAPNNEDHNGNGNEKLPMVRRRGNKETPATPAELRARFQPGNTLGRGNSHTQRQHELRKLFVGLVTEDDVRNALNKLLEKVAEGDVVAIREFLDRTIGKAAPIDGDESNQVRIVVVANDEWQRRVSTAPGPAAPSV